MREEIVDIVKPYPAGADSLIWVIPKEVRERLKIKPRQKFHVKIDGTRRVIYERINGGNG